MGTPATVAAKRATQALPIVTAAAIDPVATGLVASLSRPGGNVTGLSSGSSELSEKTVELLKEIVPQTRRIAVLLNPSNPAEPLKLNEVQTAAEPLGVQLQVLPVRDPKELDTAFTAMTRERAGALVVFHEHLFFAHQNRIRDFAVKNRLPVMYERREYVDAGGLISYGVSFRDNFRRAAVFVDRILKGAKPADLSVEQPTRFELVVNLKTAKALGLRIPQSVLIRADDVIQ
jgi:putative tryptophan/tyrosine transport system substrate-binding protein